MQNREFVIVVKAITRPAIFPGIAREYGYIHGEILDVTFRPLSTCSAARNRRMQQPRFSERIIAGLLRIYRRGHIRTFLLVLCIKSADPVAGACKSRQKAAACATGVAFNGEFIPQKRAVVARYNCCRNGICKWTVNRAPREAVIGRRKNHRIT